MGELAAKGQQERLRKQDQALTGAAVHLQGKPRRQGFAVSPAERKRIGERLKPLEAERDRAERSEGGLDRLAERPRERLDQRRFDRRARLSGLAFRLGGSFGGDFAEYR